MTWRVLAGLAAGAGAGFLVGGVGGRLAMLLLRVTSPELVLGMTSDDGFEIGVVSTDTLGLLFATTMAGGVNGVLYAVARPVIPPRLRLPLWSLVAAAVVGSAVVHEDGVDFSVLEPALLAVVLFVGLPGLAAALVVVLAERWSAAAPWADRRLAAGLLVAAGASTLALVPAAAVTAAWLLLTRIRGAAVLARSAGRVVVPLALAAVVVAAGADLVAEAARILG